MKKRLLYIATALFLVGCAQDFDLAERPAPEPQQEVAASGTITRSLDGAVYNEVIDGWMIPQTDPFALENVQAAYDKLAAGRSAQTLSKSEATEFKVGKKLAPTHYALKIYPKSEEEQWRVEMMKDVKVAYIPFSYSQLTQDEAERVEHSGKTRSAANTFTEKSPYTVTYDYTEVTDGGPTGPVTYQLPILYAVWPADKPFPADLEYVVDYPVFLPRAALTTNAETLMIMESEAQMQALGRIVAVPVAASSAKTRGGNYYYNVTGKLVAYDNVLNRDVPLANIKATHQLGSNIEEFVLDFCGSYSFIVYSSVYLRPELVFPDLLTITYQDFANRWKITCGNSTIPATRDVFVECGNDPDVLLPSVVPSDDYQLNEIYRAANYFFNGQNVFPKHYPSGGTRIVAHNVSGRSNYTPANHVINIYGYGRTNGDVVGSALHELGHLFHDLSDQGSFYDTNIFLYESFACYASWYLAQKYYESLGWISPYPSCDITTRNARQAWGKTDAIGDPGGEYSPLFVDLTDTYNQQISSYYQQRPNDNIQGVPPSVVWNIISTSKTWTQCRVKLLSYAGTGAGKYYTTAQFNEWIEAFDDWVPLYYDN